MARSPATIETLYSKGPIDPIPDIGPERPDAAFRRVSGIRGGTPATHVEKLKTRQTPTEEEVPPYCNDQHLISGAFWAYVVITIIVGIIGAFFAFDSFRDPRLRNLKKSAAFPTETFFLISGFIILLFIIWAAYRGHIGAPDDGYRYLLIITFVINLVLILIWSAVFFSQRDPKTAFFIALLLILSTVWWIWLLWPIDQAASGLLILYLVWLIYIAWACWDLVSKNNL